MAEVKGLHIKITSESTQAVNGLKALHESLEKIKNSTKGGLGLTSVANQIGKVADESNKISNTTITNLKGFAEAVKTLSGVGNIKISASIANQISAINTALSGLNIGDGATKITDLVSALKPLETLGKSSLSTTVNALNKLPEAMQKIDTQKLYGQISALTRIMKPLADEMQKVANGFNAFPSRIQKLIQANEKLSASNNKTRTSFTDLYFKIKTVYTSIVKVAKGIAKVMKNSMDYIENMNLFTVSMGGFAEEARTYSEEVSDALGIDAGEWARNQGVFMTLATGFGVAGDRANTMSKNLTQLGYDLSSFFNLPFEQAMQKLESGLAGELEPLRRIGFDLSVARLQQEAYMLGIDKKISKMTQAEKAELRYHAILTQVTTAQGDMARTLDAPANQMRILKAQVNMASRSIGNLFLPVVSAVLPYLIAFARVVRYVADSMAKLFNIDARKYEVANTFGGLASGVDDVADAFDGATESAKKLQQYTMGFDELNIIDPNKGNGSDSGDAYGGAGFDFKLPELNTDIKSIKSKADVIFDEIKGVLEEITAITGGFLMAIGLILALTGTNVPLGIGLLATGALELGAMVGLNWGTMDKQLRTTLGSITATIGGFSLALGALIALSGVNIPLGIGLMLLGATSIGTSVALNWKGTENKVNGVMESIAGVMAGGLLALGAIFAFSGANIPLGIGLMLAGALTVGSQIALNWDSLSKEVKGVIAVITTSIATALLAVGAILAFSGANIPLGIALLAGGAIAMGGVLVPAWNSLSNEVKNTVSNILGIVGGALLVIGAILAFTGVATPLGIGLMLAGAGSLGTSVGLNWGYISDKLKEVWANITKWWKTSVAPIFTVKWWADLGKNVVNGLIGSIEAGLNYIIRKINTLSWTVPDWVPVIGGKTWGFNFSEIKIPRLADGGLVSTGQMFIAREAGPELVGNIGRKTAVVNNEQIVASVSRGVAEANNESNSLLREQNSLLRALLEKESGVYLDGKKLTNSVEKYQAQRGRTLVVGGAL